MQAERLYSPDGSAFLVPQTDGNLVVYNAYAVAKLGHTAPEAALWQSGTYLNGGPQPFVLAMQQVIHSAQSTWQCLNLCCSCPPVKCVPLLPAVLWLPDLSLDDTCCAENPGLPQDCNLVLYNGNGGPRNAGNAVFATGTYNQVLHCRLS